MHRDARHYFSRLSEGTTKMRTSIAIGTFLVVGASAVSASAIQLKGSDTLEVLTKILTGEANPSTAGFTAPGYTGSPVGSGFIDFTTTAVDCGGVAQGNALPDAVQYVGTGSGNGESALASGAQITAPMSRALAGSGATGVCVGSAALQAKAASFAFALDGLAIVANTGLAACNGGAQDCSTATDPSAGIAFSSAKVITTSAGTYTISDYRDALRLIYAGFDHSAGSNRALRDCLHPARVALVESWGNVFEGACSTGSCTRVVHAFRRNDESGTTDVFASLLGLPSTKLAATSDTDPSRSAFCNTNDSGIGGDPHAYAFPTNTVVSGLSAAAAGTNALFTLPAAVYYSDVQDRDPIRRACAGNFSTGFEQVCSARGDLGVVLPIWDAPATSAADPTPAFPTTLCSPGKFVNAPVAQASFTVKGHCPNGVDHPSTSTCPTPATASGDTFCLNSPGNYYVPEGKVDGRVYNLHLRNPNKTYINSTRAVGSASGPLNINTVGGFNRIHTSRTIAGVAGAPTICAQGSATQQIGCLVGTASPCSIGYAGREATQQAGALALKVGAIDPIDQCVRYLVSTPPSGESVYPLSRKLFINTTVGSTGFGTDPQSKLGVCMTTRSIVDQAVLRTGFTTLDTTGALSPHDASLCTDFNETACTGAPANTNGCF
jgi:ABC-type phosphate transport system substrate-binding protein